MKSEAFLTMSDGQQIFTSIYEPAAGLKMCGYVHLLHGMAEHSGRYHHFCEMLSNLGYFVVTHDHRGHGKTAEAGGKLGFFTQENGFERVVEDVYELTTYMCERYALPRPLLFGHSMGSFILRRFMQLHDELVEAAILCATGDTTPLHFVGFQIASVLSKVQGADVESPLLNDLSYGSFNKHVPNPLTAFDWLTRDYHSVQRFMDDPHCGFVATNQFFVDLTSGLLTINQTKQIARTRSDLPILLISGSDDPVGGKRASGVFSVANKMQQAGLEHVAVYIFEGMRHEILNEYNKEHVYEVVTRWLKNEQKI